MVYLVPSDKSIRDDYQVAISNAILNLQQFYQKQVGNSNAFSTHTPLVEVYVLPHPSSFYKMPEDEFNAFFTNVLRDGFAASGGTFDDPNNRWIYYIDTDEACGQGLGGVAGVALLGANDLRGLTNQPRIPTCGGPSDPFGYDRWVGGLGHELGHAFGLPHPPGCDPNGACDGGDFARNSLMYFGYATYPDTYLLTEDKNSLLATGFFTSFNLIDSNGFFVRQQYLDYLNREPDAGGFGYWTNQITQCGSDAQCIHDRRVGVADAFFFEPEFQQTGAYIYRIYKAAIGLKPSYAQFISDRGRVVSGPGLDQSKSAYALFFVQSPAFQQEYATASTADQFVDRMLAIVKNYSGVDLSAQRTSLIALYDGTDTGKAAILRQVAESQPFIDAEYNNSFVLMEYFGYLRRDPDQGGFDFWLGQVNKYPLRNVSIQHAMACSFITSAEYQTRFSSIITHTNRECPQ
jgi:hypothetical protein